MTRSRSNIFRPELQPLADRVWELEELTYELRARIRELEAESRSPQLELLQRGLDDAAASDG